MFTWIDNHKISLLIQCHSLFTYKKSILLKSLDWSFNSDFTIFLILNFTKYIILWTIVVKNFHINLNILSNTSFISLPVSPTLYRHLHKSALVPLFFWLLWDRRANVWSLSSSPFFFCLWMFLIVKFKFSLCNFKFFNIN